MANQGKKQISRRDFLLNSLLAVTGIGFGGALAFYGARFLRGDAQPDIVLSAEEASYFLNRQDIEIFMAEKQGLGAALLDLLPNAYYTKIPFTPNSSYQVQRLFAESQLGIEPIPVFVEAMRFAEASYEQRQIALANLANGNPLAVPVNRRDYTQGMADFAERPYIVTGDSFSFGIGVDYEETYANLLFGQKHLNLAVFGHGTVDQLRRFEQFMSISPSIAGKTVLHFVHANDLLNDLVSNFYWHFYGQAPRSYNSDFLPKFSRLMQQARDNGHEGLGFYALSPEITSAAPRIAMPPYHYDANGGRYVPQLSFFGLRDKPIICDPEMNYFAGTIADVAALHDLDPETLVTEDFSTELKFRYSDGTSAATGFHRLGGFDWVDLTLARLGQFRDLVEGAGGRFLAFRLGCFEDYAFEHLGYETAMSEAFGAVLPDDLDPKPVWDAFDARAREQGIPYYSLVAETIESAALLAGMNKTAYYLGDTHFTPLGHLLNAAIVRETLRQHEPEIFAGL